MRHSIFLLILFALAFAGCKQPAEVELTDDLVFENVIDDQPTLERQAVDSTGLLPKDETTFAGQIFLGSITTRSARGVETVAYSRVVFEDRARPILGNDGTRRGFIGIHLGNVTFNGESMVERIRRVANTVGGFDYFRLVTYVPRQRFTWNISSPLTVGAFDASIETPDDMVVVSPVGGSVISRNEDLELRWHGRGEIGLIVSAAIRDQQNPNRFITRPIFSGTIRKETGRVRVSRKILRALPSAESYILTFVRMNRDIRTIGRFNGKILVQAVSIHNSVIALR